MDDAVAKRSRQRALVGFEEAGDATPPPAARPTVRPAAPSETPRDDSDLRDQTVYAIDAHNLIYQVFHAMPEMTGPSGQPVGAVQGFVRDLLDLIEVRQASYLIVAFDHPGKTFRDDLYDEYKAKREEMPADLQLQIPVIHQFLDALGILTLSLEGFEADDILATIARQVEAAGGRCLLVTTDKDCRQLISDRVQLFNKRTNEIFYAAALQKTSSIRPDQGVDFQSLAGDPTNTITAVPR